MFFYMTPDAMKHTHPFIFFLLVSTLLISCNAEEPVAEPTPRPVVAASQPVQPTATPQPTDTPEPTVEPTVEPTATEVEDASEPTIDPENDGTLLTIPVMQDAPIVLDFNEVNDELIAEGVGPIAPASSVSFTFTGFPGQTFKAQVEGGTFGTALLKNGQVISMSLIQGRATVWELTQPGEYEFALSNGGKGANYRYTFSLSKPENPDITLPPQQIQFGQGINERVFQGEFSGDEPVVYLFQAIEGQSISFVLIGESGRIVVQHPASGEQFEPATGTSALEIGPLSASGEYRIEVWGPSAEPFALTVSLLP